ncbi:Z-ring formation inhibitor MciZ [Paenibacillus solani]|uniref:Z-ring formation inhibitor MciZ n=1 Tax=Paenibacillus solani TaxID=1705565 RepID=UPI0009EA63C8|nr:Z-ring formation inhibitor MciZ [Paenibacillus solani]
MKSYKGEHSIHMVGQAWQIRIMLKQWQQQWGPGTMIKDILTKNRSDIDEK